MPLEIRELTIKVNVESAPTAAPAINRADWEAVKDKVVKECMEKLSELIKSYGDR